MSSDVLTDSILRTLAASKPGGSFLELGTGGGLSTAWLLAGMDSDSTLITIENDETLYEIAKKHLGTDPRVDVRYMNGGEFIQTHMQRKFDLIFADTWPGKFYFINEVLNMVRIGGMYVVDDLSPFLLGRKNM